MSFIQNFYTSRDNNTDGNTYIGQVGRLWYNPNTNSVYVSDGTTAGGVPVALATGADIVASDVALNSITSRTGTILIEGNIDLVGSANISGDISPATTTKIGGIKAGPGVDVSNDGTLTIDTANLPLSFGNFTASNNVLTIVNVDEDMILSTQGDAEIQLIGNIGFYKPDGLPPDIGNRYFYATNDGAVHSRYLDIQSYGATGLAAPFNITIDPTGNYRAPAVLPDAIAQFTGNSGVKSFVIQDNYGVEAGKGSGGQYVFRTARGTVDTPSAIQADDFLGDVVAAGWASNGYGGQPSGFYRIVANENFTPTARGGRLEMWVVPDGTITETKVATVNSNGIVVVGTVSATGNVNGANLISGGAISAISITATGNVVSGNLNTVGRVTATGNISTSNYFIGNAAFVTGINAFGNVYANGTSVFATSGSSALTLSIGNNVVITGDNGTRTVTIGVKDAPTFTGNVSGNRFIGNGAPLTNITGANVTGTVASATTATNLTAATGILAGTVSIDPASVLGGISSVQTFTLPGITTNHKIVITSGTALNSGLIITAAWVSASNTLSIEFRNTTNQPIDLGTITIQYFAWI